jgi:Family of unknown function (DUF6318)
MTSHNVFTSRLIRSGAVSMIVAAAVMLAGCAGGAPADPGTASPTATESTSPSPSATPTPTTSAAYKPADASGPAQNVPVPVLPDVAKTETKEGLEAFVRYWYATLNYAFETGKTEKLVEISGPSCVFCHGLQDGVAEAWSEGRWVSGGKIETPAISVKFEPGVEPHAVVQVLQETIEIRKPDGSLFQAPTAATNTGSRAAATFGSTGWTMTDLGLIR